LIPKPEARCSRAKTVLQNEPDAQRSLRRFRTRRQRKIFNLASLRVNPTKLLGAQPYKCESFLEKVLEIRAKKQLSKTIATRRT